MLCNVLVLSSCQQAKSIPSIVAGVGKVNLKRRAPRAPPCSLLHHVDLSLNCAHFRVQHTPTQALPLTFVLEITLLDTVPCSAADALARNWFPSVSILSCILLLRLRHPPHAHAHAHPHTHTHTHSYHSSSRLPSYAQATPSQACAHLNPSWCLRWCLRCSCACLNPLGVFPSCCRRHKAAVPCMALADTSFRMGLPTEVREGLRHLVPVNQYP